MTNYIVDPLSGELVYHPSTSSGEKALYKTPAGQYQVTKLYVDPDTGKLVVEYDDTPAPDYSVPEDKFEVTSLYVNSSTLKLVVEYDDRED